jgi:mannitol/fructose-specific phosphotransferase system IIA component (Ntr-type)
MNIKMTIWLTLGFAAGMLTVGRWLIHRLLPWLQAYSSWPGGVLGFALSLALLSAAFTEWIGVHAIFGAFLAGVAVGDTPHLREQTRNIIREFVSFIFAPLFFASIGLHVNFVAQFDGPLVLVVLVIACLGKVLGCGLGGLASGMRHREAWAAGFGMNARGAMEIILGLLALQYGVIHERMFVALVIMALITSLMSGPAMQWLLRSKKPRRLLDFLSARTFIARLAAGTSREAVRELSRAVAGAAGLNEEEVDKAVWMREEIMSTALGEGLAVPHARIGGLGAPLVGIGLSERGIDFNSADGNPARIVFLILTPARDNGAQLEILADIARIFSRREMHQKTFTVANYVQFLALMRSESVPPK